MRRRRHAVGMLLGAGLLGAGCNLLLGLDPGGDKPTTTGGSGGTTGSGTMSATGGATTVTPTVATAGGGTGGVTGTGGGEIDAGPACEAGASVACYTGPTGTAGIGVCQAGTRVCAADGSGYGPCSGEVLPGAELCAQRGDEDCDGVGCSDVLWARCYGDTAAQYAHALAVDAQQDLVVLGSLGGTISIQSTVASTGSGDVLLAKIGSDGTSRWVSRYGNSASQSPGGLAVDANGEIFLAGHFQGTVTFDPLPALAANGTDVFVARVGPQHEPRWSSRFGEALAQRAWGVAVDKAGDVIVVGDLFGSMTFGATTLTNPTTTSTATCGWVAKLGAADGAPSWALPLCDAAAAGAVQALAVAVSPKDGGIYVAGSMTGSVAVGAQNLDSAGGPGAFLVKLDGGGVLSWAKAFTSASAPLKITSVAAAANGDVVIAGVSGEAVKAAGVPWTSGNGLFAARCDASGGYLWGRSFGGTLGSSTIVAAVDGGGNVVLAGGFKGTADWSGGPSPLSSNGNSNLYVAKLDPAGQHLWSKAFADGGGADDARAVAVLPGTGRIVVAGKQHGVVDYGTDAGALGSSGIDAGADAGDMFVAELEP